MRSLLVAVLVLLVASPSRLGAVELDALIKESQKMKSENNTIVMVWWLTEEFWAESFKKQASLTDAQRAEFSKVMKPYTVFCVAALDVGVMGSLTPRGRDLIATNIQLSIGEKKIAPLTHDEISADATNFYLMMKPAMANMLGQIGKGLEFFVYSSKASGDGLNPSKKGAFTFTAFEHTFNWRLPLGSLLPPKLDPLTKEEFPGNFDFNPYTGKQLVLKKD
jgi:hypothetical protein